MCYINFMILEQHSESSNDPSLAVVLPKTIPVTASDVLLGARSQKAMIMPISQLQEYCQQNKLKEPDYRELPSQTGSEFQFTVIVNDKSYTGSVKSKKQEAKHSAAEVAFQQVSSSKL